MLSREDFGTHDATEMPPKARAGVMNGVLGKQLASITESLAQASKRRDSEVMKKAGREAGGPPTPAPYVKSPMSAVPTHTASNGGKAGESESELVDTDRSPKTPNEPISVLVPTFFSMEAKAEGVFSTPDTTLTGSAKSFSDPFSGFQESLRVGEAPQINDHPRKMLADLERNLRSPSVAVTHEIEDDLDRLRAEMASLLLESDGEDNNDGTVDMPSSPMLRQAAETEDSKAPHEPKVALEKDGLPSVVALQLEKTGCNWEQVKAWTEYLFSNGLNGYTAQKEKEAIIQRAELELEQTKEYVLSEEAVYRAAEEKASLPFRLLVTNIAADADEEELAVLFWDFRFEM